MHPVSAVYCHHDMGHILHTDGTGSHFELGHNTRLGIKATKDGSRDGRAKKYTNKSSRDNLEGYLGLIGLINNR